MNRRCVGCGKELAAHEEYRHVLPDGTVAFGCYHRDCPADPERSDRARQLVRDCPHNRLSLFEGVCYDCGADVVEIRRARRRDPGESQ